MRFLRELLETLVLAILIFVAVQTTLQSFQIQFESMKPSLLPGQRLVVNKVLYFSFDWGKANRLVPFLHKEGGRVFLFHPPQRGDVIVFEPPLPSASDYIKRVIGLPGERVEIKGGKVYIDNQPIAEPYIAAPPNYVYPPEAVPPGYYFVLGDNRNNSSDSHTWGFVPLKNLVGKAWVSFWPLDRWGWAPNYSFAHSSDIEQAPGISSPSREQAGQGQGASR
ncbi:MAG: signal peptidase I [Chloroflexi bacterium]|nr:signal peptidase I [Chloroflexota bacterium]